MAPSRDDAFNLFLKLELSGMDHVAGPVSKPGILQIIHGFIEGGSERQMVQICSLLQDSGQFDVHVASLSKGGVLRPLIDRMQIPVVDFPLTSFYGFSLIQETLRFVSYLKRHQIRIVHSHDFYSNIFGMTGAVLAGVGGRIASKRETTGTRTGAQTAAERIAFKLAGIVVANAGTVKEHLIELGVPDEKIVIVYNGVDVNRFHRNGTSACEVLERLNLTTLSARPLITMVANFEHRVKDHSMLLRAAQRVKTEVPEAVFVIAGEGDLRGETERLAIALGLKESCVFIGRCDRVPDLLAASDICVLSSQAEGFSNSILEYMAAGRPVVATNVGGASEAIQEGETGYLIPAGDDQAMAGRLISLLREPETRHAMGAKGQVVVEQKFSCKNRLAKTVALYQRFVS